MSAPASSFGRPARAALVACAAATVFGAGCASAPAGADGSRLAVPAAMAPAASAIYWAPEDARWQPPAVLPDYALQA